MNMDFKWFYWKLGLSIFVSQIHSIFSKTRVGGSKTVRSFSENSSKMESLGFPAKLYENLPSHKLTLCTVWTWWVWRLGHSCVDGHPNIANRSKTEKNQNGKNMVQYSCCWWLEEPELSQTNARWLRLKPNNANSSPYSICLPTLFCLSLKYQIFEILFWNSDQLSADSFFARLWNIGTSKCGCQRQKIWKVDSIICRDPQ